MRNKNKIKLFSADQKKYGHQYREHVLEQYRIYVEGIDKISERRERANTFFLSLNTFLMTALGFFVKEEFSANIELLVLILGVLICFVWARTILSYRQMNTGKFTVLHQVEEKLPLALYRTEWSILEKGRNAGRYLPFSHLEGFVPYLFLACYILFTLLTFAEELGGAFGSVIDWIEHLSRNAQ
ncbi:MAG: hypothetical protein WC777_01845 [Candidatus Gracilibacteria bacterium]|jgi:hypothetical protein